MLLVCCGLSENTICFTEAPILNYVVFGQFCEARCTVQAVQYAISIYIGTNLKTSFCLFFALSCSDDASTYDWPAEVDKGWGLTQMMDDNQPTRLTADTKDVCSKLWRWRRYCPGKTTAGGDKHQGFTFLGSYLPLMYWPVVRPCNASGFPMYWSSDFAKERNSATVRLRTNAFCADWFLSNRS